jgi:hypothetical protein
MIEQIALTDNEREILNRAQFLTPSTLEDNPVHAAVEIIVAARVLAMRARMTALADKWDQDRAEYPTDTDPRAVVADVAVQLCGEELRAVLAAEEET